MGKTVKTLEEAGLSSDSYIRLYTDKVVNPTVAPLHAVTLVCDAHAGCSLEELMVKMVEWHAAILGAAPAVAKYLEISFARANNSKTPATKVELVDISGPPELLNAGSIKFKWGQEQIEIKIEPASYHHELDGVKPSDLPRRFLGMVVPIGTPGQEIVACIDRIAAAAGAKRVDGDIHTPCVIANLRLLGMTMYVFLLEGDGDALVLKHQFTTLKKALEGDPAAADKMRETYLIGATAATVLMPGGHGLGPSCSLNVNGRVKPESSIEVIETCYTAVKHGVPFKEAAVKNGWTAAEHKQ